MLTWEVHLAHTKPLSRMHSVSESSRGVGGGLQLQTLFLVKVEHAIKPQHTYVPIHCCNKPSMITPEA